MRLLIFNPETDLALAVGRKAYTAPRQIVELRCNLAPAMLSLARSGDAFLLLDGQQPPAERPDILFLRPEQLRPCAESITEVVPWGWNHSLLRQLLAWGVRPSAMPTTEDIDNLRELAHRRSTIEFHALLNDWNDGLLPLTKEIPLEATEVEDWVGEVVMKAPWSSSGRGVRFGAHPLSDISRKWALGVINRQGSVMVEKRYVNLLDFATEWFVKKSTATFLGFSVFATSESGGYSRNIRLPQRELEQIILEKSGIDATKLNEIVKLQQKALEKVVENRYSGPVGIDMMVCENNNHEKCINACVEMNFRHTMGMVAMAKEIGFS